MATVHRPTSSLTEMSAELHSISKYNNEIIADYSD